MDDVYTSLESGINPCASSTVKKLSRVLGRVYDLKLSAAGINITQLAVLRCITRRRGEPLVRVAEEMEMDRTSLYRAVAPMIREGWIISAKVKGARFHTARITPKGRRLLANANRYWEDIQSSVIGRFGQKEYDSLLAELYRLADCATESSRSHESR
jgi:DNA-binding MarR family transcriptional regulator